jgi:nucleotide-binding universal stress UspA family protein
MSETPLNTSRAPQPAGEGLAGTQARRLFNDVLCAVDGSPGGYSAVEQAAQLTGPDGQITLLAVTSFRSAGKSRSPAIAPLRAKEILDRATQIADDVGVRTTVEVDPAAPPAEVILEWAAEHDLLAMGAPTTPWPVAMFGGGPTASAVSTLDTPLLAARPQPGGAGGPIVVASDGLDGSDRLVEWAAELARAQQVELRLFHVEGRVSRRRKDRIAAQGEALERALGESSSVRIESGAARSVIAEGARDAQARLIVMGSRRLHGPRAVGSVSRHVVHRAESSVLLIPPEPF